MRYEDSNIINIIPNIYINELIKMECPLLNSHSRSYKLCLPQLIMFIIEICLQFMCYDKFITFCTPK